MNNNCEINVNNILDNITIYKDLISSFDTLDNNFKNGCAYLRVSTEMQTEFSPEAQLEDIIKYCIQNKIMLEKENIFLEPGISGTRADKRPQFQMMIEKAKTKPKPFDVILVHKLDRFSRNREDSIIYKSMLRKKYNIDIIAVKEPLPEDKKLALMMESQLETWGEYYSMNLSDEVYKGLRKKAERGEHASRPPLGYKKIITDVKMENQRQKVIRKMVIVPDEAEIVKMIFSNYANGATQKGIARELNSLGQKTKYGGEFTNRCINWILHNPVYIGYMRWTEGCMYRDWYKENAISKKSNHEAIISQELWDRVQKRLLEESEIYSNRTRPETKHEHWLRGLLRCDNCGSILVKNNKYFQCSGYTHAKCNISHTITVKAVEDAIKDELKINFTNKPINIEISLENTTQKNEISILSKQLEQIEIKENRIKIAYENGIDTLEEYRENKERLKKDKKLISDKISKLNSEQDINTIRDNIFKRCKDAYEILNDDNVDIKDKILIAHQLFEKIIFVKNEHKLIIYYK